jgi:multiple sugar transport system substrate-binding protein
MKKNILAALLCGAVMVASFAGCAQKTAGQSSAGSSGKAAASEAGGGSKNVVIWDYFETDAQKEMMQKLISGFNSSQKEYKASHVYVPFADYQKQLTLAKASNQLPDLVILDGCSMASFISMGLFQDVSDAGIKWDDYIEGPMKSTMMDGKHYGIPFATNCTALLYNKDLFDKASVKYPDENTTWDEFHAMAKKLTKNGVYGFGNAATNTDEGTFQCLQWIYTAGGSYTNVKAGADAFKLMQDMIKDGSWAKEAVNWTQSDVNNNFMAGNLAMEQNGPWQIPVIKKSAPQLKYGVTVLPKRNKDAKQATSILGGENIGVIKKDNSDGAVAFMKYYDKTDVMVEAMKAYGSFPPKTEAAKDSYWTGDPIQAAFIKQLSTSIPRGPSPQWPQYSTAIQNGVQQAMTGAKTPQQAAEDTQKAVDAIK